MIDINNTKKLWEWSLFLEAPFSPRFRDEEDTGALLLETSTPAGASRSSYTMEYSFVESMEVSPPMPSGEAA